MTENANPTDPQEHELTELLVKAETLHKQMVQNTALLDSWQTL